MTDLSPDLISSWQRARATLKRIWGYAEFRPPQGEIIQTLLTGQDALIVLPTGAGKSICFQLPALLQTGLTLVISPLVALMENQVEELQQRQLAAARFHSELTPSQRRQTLRAIEKQQLRLLYLSPESLLSQGIWERLCQPDLKLNGLILDEAHCLAQWGDSFRPAYRRLGAVRPALLQLRPAGTKLAIAAFTATADPQVQQQIQTVLQLQQPQVFRYSPYRPNLQLQVHTSCTPSSRRRQLVKLLQAQPHTAGLVYARTRRDCEVLADWLNQSGYQTAAYHGGLSAPDRRRLEAAWLRGKLPFVICTSAFGMGINKANVRWVCHFHPPLTLAEYIQEMGRAGRDGQESLAGMLVSEPTGWFDPSDRQRRQYFAQQLQAQQQTAAQLAIQLPPEGNINAVRKKFGEAPIALSLLHSAGRLTWTDPFHYQIHSGHSTRSPLDLNQRAIAQMVEYIHSRSCRWQFLLQAFGFSAEAKNFRCGHCDNCLKGRS